MQHFSIGVVTFSPLSSFCTTTAANCFQSLLSRIVAFVDVTFFFLSFGASSVNDHHHHCFFFFSFFNCCLPLVGNCQLHYTATTTAQMLHNQLRRKCVCVLFKVCCCCFGREVKVALQSLALSSMGATFFSWGHGCPMPHLTWSFSHFSMNEHLELRSFLCDSLQVTGSALWSFRAFCASRFWLLTDRLSWLLELSTKSFSSFFFSYFLLVVIEW